MEIDLELYKIFVSVSSNGSFSKASEELSVTQSAVSQMIIKLEGIYGKELFVRSRQGVTLTSFGKLLFDEVSSGVKELCQVYEKLTNYRKSEKTIKIGASDTITTNILTPIIKKHFEGTHFYVESLYSDKEKILAMENGTLDFAIINDYNLPLGSRLYKKKLLSLEYGFFYNDKALKIDENNIFDQTLLIKNAGTKGRVEFNKKFYHLAFKFKNIMEFSHDDIIIQAAKNGLGIGFCPREYVSNDLKEIKFSDEKVIKNVVLIYEQASEVIDTVLKEVSENFAK